MSRKLKPMAASWKSGAASKSAVALSLGAALAACSHMPERPQFQFERGEGGAGPCAAEASHELWQRYCDIRSFAEKELEEARIHASVLDAKNLLTFGAATYLATTIALNTDGLTAGESTDLREAAVGAALLQATGQIYSPVAVRDNHLRAYHAYSCVAENTHLALTREAFVRQAERLLQGDPEMMLALVDLQAFLNGDDVQAAAVSARIARILDMAEGRSADEYLELRMLARQSPGLSEEAVLARAARAVQSAIDESAGLRHDVAALQSLVRDGLGDGQEELETKAQEAAEAALAEIARATSQVNAYYNLPDGVVQARDGIYENMISASARQELTFATVVQSINAIVASNTAFLNKPEQPPAPPAEPEPTTGEESGEEESPADQARAIMERLSLHVATLQRITPNIRTIAVSMGQCETVISTGVRASPPTLEDIGAGPLPSASGDFFSPERKP